MIRACYYKPCTLTIPLKIGVIRGDRMETGKSPALSNVHKPFSSQLAICFSQWHLQEFAALGGTSNLYVCHTLLLLIGLLICICSTFLYLVALLLCKCFTLLLMVALLLFLCGTLLLLVVMVLCMCSILILLVALLFCKLLLLVALFLCMCGSVAQCSTWLQCYSECVHTDPSDSIAQC